MDNGKGNATMQNTDETEHLLASPANANRLRQSVAQALGRTQATREPCKWRGGNDFMECSVCGLEFDYRKHPMPPCGAAARIAELELIAYGERLDGN